MSVTFQPDREGTLYVGTRVSLVCLTVVTVDTTLVDTDVIVDIAFNHLPAGINANRITTERTMLNDSASQGIVDFAFLLPSDEGVAFRCVPTLRPVNSLFLDSTPLSTDTTLTLDDIAGELMGGYTSHVHACIIIRLQLFC